MNKTLLLATIVTATIVTGIMVTSEIVFAQSENSLKNGRPAAAMQSGELSVINLQCPNGDEFNNVLGSRFQHDSNTPKLSPAINPMRVFNFVSPAKTIEAVTSLTILKNDQFHIEGIVFDDTICGEVLPMVFTLIGTCGFNQAMTFQTNTGIVGTFEGNIACV